MTYLYYLNILYIALHGWNIFSTLLFIKLKFYQKAVPQISKLEENFQKSPSQLRIREEHLFRPTVRETNVGSIPITLCPASVSELLG